MVRRWGAVFGWPAAAMVVSGFPVRLEAADDLGQYVYSLIVLGIALLAAIAVWWWIDVRSRPREVPERASQVAAPDDLTRIEGIGPKISGLLQGAGISTFADLAEASVDRLQGIIAAAGLTALSDPRTWPEQARLAAEGQWERLDTMQAELKGGRRK
jgi:hypothetical protein